MTKTKRTLSSAIKLTATVLALGLILQYILTGTWIPKSGDYWFIGFGVCLDLMSWTVTAPGATGTNMTAVDLATIRNGTRKPYGIQIVAAWCNSQLAGSTKFIFPSGNDQTRNIMWLNIANQIDNKIAWGSPVYVRPQDPITVTQIGSVTAGDIETVHALVYYEDLIGPDAHLINMATLMRRGQRYITVADTLGAITSSGAYAPAAGRALNAGTDLLKADTLYAVVGYVVGARVGAIGLRGTDFGGLRVGGPGNVADSNWTCDWFSKLSEAHGLPLIPVFNSGNRAGIFTDAICDENAVTVPFQWNLVELGPAPGEAAVASPVTQARV